MLERWNGEAPEEEPDEPFEWESQDGAGFYDLDAIDINPAFEAIVNKMWAEENERPRGEDQAEIDSRKLRLNPLDRPSRNFTSKPVDWGREGTFFNGDRPGFFADDDNDDEGGVRELIPIPKPKQ